MIRRQVIVLEVEYDDADSRRHQPAEWDWNTLADMGGDEQIEVLARGFVLAPREDATDYELAQREASE